MEILIACAILVTTLFLAVVEYLILPVLAFLACSIIVAAVIERFGEYNAQTTENQFQSDFSNQASEYRDAVHATVSDGSGDGPDTSHLPLIFS